MLAGGYAVPTVLARQSMEREMLATVALVQVTCYTVKGFGVKPSHGIVRR